MTIESLLCRDLEVLCAAPGVSGAETGAGEAALRLFDELGVRAQADRFGNIIAVLRRAQPGEKTVLLDAHLDQIGFTVTGLEPGGFLRVAPCGGMDRRVLAATAVTIWGKTPLEGMISSVPPHLSTGEERKKVPDFDDVLVDTGLSDEDLKKLVAPGDRITLPTPLRRLAGTRVTASALDDRCGAAVLLEAVRLLKEQELRCGVTLLFSVQEEVHSAGALTAGYRLNADIALAVDVSFAYAPGLKKRDCGELGKGPMIGFSPALDASLSRRLTELAKEQDIPFQTEIMGGRTGTNADALSTLRGGRVTGLLSVPQRSMHTPAELIDLADAANTARLLALYVQEVR